MVKVEHLSFAYPSRTIFSDISFEVAPGECLGILGNNGAGKSTLVTCINRIRTPKSGRVTVAGGDVARLSRRERAQRIAYVAQKFEASCTSVYETVLLGRLPYMRSVGPSLEDLERCDAIIDELGLQAHKMRDADTLSGGELQRVMLARALVGQPKLLLLDEPTSSLDMHSQYVMLSHVRQMARRAGFAVIMVIHDINLALAFCDRFLFLNDARVAWHGPAHEVSAQTIESVYHIQAQVRQIDGRTVVLIDPEGTVQGAALQAS